MNTSTAGNGPTEPEPTLSRWNVGPVLAAGVFMIISLFGVTLGGPAASGTTSCFDQSAQVAIAAHQSPDQAPTCDEVSIQAPDEAASSPASRSTAGSVIGWIMFSLLSGLILLSLATGRELPETAEL